MTGKQMREKLHAGERVYGSMIVGRSSRWPSAVKSTGLDFAFLDSEHGAFDRGELSKLCRQYEALDMVPVVRIPSPDPFEACKALDGGAMGIIGPYVETVTQVRAIVGAVRFRPLKGARLEELLDDSGALGAETEKYLADRNQDKIAIVNIESLPAIAALDDILAVPGLDAVLIGPHDLSCNMGIPERYTDRDFLEAVKTIITRARAKGLGAGIHFGFNGEVEAEIEWIKMGANLVTHSIDISAFRSTLKTQIDALKAAAGDK